MDDADLNDQLIALASRMPGTRIVPGTTYYLYTQNGTEVLSRIAHDEWSNYEKYHGQFLYDYDYVFKKQRPGGVGGGGIEVLSEAMRLMPPVEVSEADAAKGPVEGRAVPETPRTPICPVLSRW